MALDSRKIARRGKTGKNATAHKGFALCCSAWGIGEGRQEGETGGGEGEAVDIMKGEKECFLMGKRMCSRPSPLPLSLPSRCHDDGEKPSRESSFPRRGSLPSDTK